MSFFKLARIININHFLTNYKLHQWHQVQQPPTGWPNSHCPDLPSRNKKLPTQALLNVQSFFLYCCPLETKSIWKKIYWERLCRFNSTWAMSTGKGWMFLVDIPNEFCTMYNDWITRNFQKYFFYKLTWLPQL